MDLDMAELATETLDDVFTPDGDVIVIDRIIEHMATDGYGGWWPLEVLTPSSDLLYNYQRYRPSPDATNLRPSDRMPPMGLDAIDAVARAGGIEAE